MTVAVVVLAVVLIAVLLLHDRQVKAWTDERQLLLERIQAPERVSIVTAVADQEPLESDAPYMALVGQIDPQLPMEEDAHA